MIKREKIEKILNSHLQKEEYSVVDVVDLSQQKDRMTIVRSIQEAIEDFDNSESDAPNSYYLLEIQKKIKQAPKNLSDNPEVADPLHGIYLRDGSLNVDKLEAFARILLDAKDFAAAKKIFYAILRSGAASSEAHFGIGKCEVGLKEVDRAIYHFEESIAFYPNAPAYQELVKLLVSKKKYLYGAECLERALHLEEINSETKYELRKAAGNCWTKLKREEKALENYQAALQIKPRSDEIRTSIAAMYLLLGKVSQARTGFQDALSANEENVKALIGLGCCLIAEKKMAMAHDIFVRALVLDSVNPTALFYLTKCAFHLKKYDKAEQLVSDYVSDAPVSPSLLYCLAGMQFQMKKYSDAKRNNQKVLDLRPAHKGALDLRRRLSELAQ